MYAIIPLTITANSLPSERWKDGRLSHCLVFCEIDTFQTILERTNFEFNKRGLPPEKIRPTVGLNLGRVTIKGKQITFFDLGGQQGLRRYILFNSIST